MPIPVRANSVRKHGESGIPTRQPSIRQQVRSKTEQAIDQQIAPTESTHPESTSTRLQPQNTQGRDLRGLSRTPSIAYKSVVSHGRSVSTVSVSELQKRVSTKQPPKIASTATDNKNTGLVTKPRPLSQLSPSQRTHTRSISAATANKPPVPRFAASNVRNVVSRTTSDASHTGDLTTHIPTTAESSLLREELLQLQIVYAESSSNLSSYQQNIRKIIDREINTVLRLQDGIMESETLISEAEQGLALQNWLHQVQHCTDEEKIQRLSMVTASIDKYLNCPELLEPLDQFELWLQETLQLRENRSIAVETELLFSAPLGPKWRFQMSDLEEQLCALRDTLEQFGSADHAAGIGLALQMSTQTISTLIQEVTTAVSLEETLRRAESVWEKQEVEKVLQSLSNQTYAPKNSGIWT